MIEVARGYPPPGLRSPQGKPPRTAKADIGATAKREMEGRARFVGSAGIDSLDSADPHPQTLGRLDDA